MQLRQQQEALSALDVRVLVVTFEGVGSARHYLSDTDLPWPLLLDEERTLYRAYGMERGRWWQVYGPRTLWAYLKLLLSGRRLEAAGADPDQLGGDVLIDPDGIVRLHYVSDNPADRPSVASLIAQIRRSGGPPRQGAG